jgi:hypothetical protein
LRSAAPRVPGPPTLPRTLAPFARRFRNLIGLPSCHYDGMYGRAVREAIALNKPQVIALEVPACLMPELEWAARCWPVPVASVSRHATLPCLPGDSIFEAFRAGRSAGLTIVPVDVDLAADGHHDGVSLPGAELGERVGPSFAEMTSSLAALAVPHDTDIAREAAMARALAALMLRFESVLWVGGVAHWNRLIERFDARDFEAPSFPSAPERSFVRTRLAASALYRLTGQWPWLVANFAAAPDRFDPVDAERRLLHQATRLSRRRRGVSHEAPSGVESVRGVMDVARTAVYARNLAATRGLRELPSLAELLLAARATIGDVYAARVYRLAMHDNVTDATRALPALTWEVAPGARRAGYRLKSRWLTTEAWLRAGDGALALPEFSELDRAARDGHYKDLPRPHRGDRFFWGAYPPDEAAYEEFVRYLLRRASVSDEDAGRSAPFSCGMRDGLDVRATIRHWQDGTLYVREKRRGALRFTNGVIDWTSRTERSPILWNRGASGQAGWNDPDSPHVGSCSREVQPHDVLFSLGQSEATLRHREWSVLTLDCPTYLDRPRGRQTFWGAVIEHLLSVQGTSEDHLHTWFEAMCRFCAGKPLVYYSRYVPGPGLFAIARVHCVRLVWSPLDRIPAPLLVRHRTFRQLHLSTSQWKELRRRLSEARGGVPDFARLIA